MKFLRGSGRGRRSNRMSNNSKQRQKGGKRKSSSSHHAPFIYDYLWQCWTQQSDRLQPHVEWFVVEQALDSQHVPVDEIRYACRYSDEIDRDGMLLLHFLCALCPPIILVETLIAANPAAVRTKSKIGGLTPLMVACGRNASPSVIRILCNHDPQALNRIDAQGYSAIHWSARQNVSYEIMKLILKIDPSQSYKKIVACTSISTSSNQDGSTASIEEDDISSSNLHNNNNNNNNNDNSNCVTALEILYQNRSSSSSSLPRASTQQQPLLQPWDTNAWKKVELLLWSQHYGSILARSEHSYSTLHAALACDNTPLDVINTAISYYASYAAGVRDNIGDMQGNLPLYYAINNPTVQRQHIVKLLDAFPQSATEKNSDGDLPLHQAIRAGKTWYKGGVDTIYKCNPAAASVPDVKLGLPPSLLCSALYCSGDGDDLDTSFELLRELPEVICNYKPVEEEDERRIHGPHRQSGINITR